MNFFEHQDHARRQTLWLIVLFGIAVIAIVVVMDLLVLLLLGSAGSGASTSSGGSAPAALLSADNAPLLIGTSVLTLAVISLASLYRIASLRSGGSSVATELGGVLVGADVRDPLRRRLRNVVEEVALAAGVPVPDIYVMEQESAINAFAAGYTPADAAIAVTRGTLEKLDRDQLQGVIAHEFSHILNGDMRLNIRLMGIIFGILMMSIIGRHLLYASRPRSYSSSSKNGNGIVVIAIGVIVIGYVGQFFGNWIKAAVSRKREFLADASAVQFTRNPDGIAGALKRIAVDASLAQPDQLSVDSSEVSHMLFSGNALSSLMATHPPLTERIQRIQPGFREQQLVELAQRIERKQELARQQAAAERELDAASTTPATVATGFALGNILGNIGNPTQQQMLYAALLSASFPDPVHEAAHSPEWAPAVLCLLLLGSDRQLRDEQLYIIASTLGADTESQCRYLAEQLPDISPQQRLPLAELSMPALKRRPPQDLRQLGDTVDALIAADGEVSLFEYAIGRMLRVHIRDALDPAAVRPHGKRTLSALQAEASQLLHCVAAIGHDDPSQAQAAASAGLSAAGLAANLTVGPATSAEQDWRGVLDATLAPLDTLSPGAKQALLAGLFATVTHDHQVKLEESEVLRAICAALHVPLPLNPTS